VEAEQGGCRGWGSTSIITHLYAIESTILRQQTPQERNDIKEKGAFIYDTTTLQSPSFVYGPLRHEEE